MATRRYMCNPQDANFQVTEAVGAATVSKTIEITVDFTALTSAGLSDTQAKMQVINALTKVSEYVSKGVWPPA